MDRSIQEEWNRRFHGKTLVESKYVPKFPASNEREYLRLSSDLMSSVVMECLKKHLPAIRDVIAEVDNEQHYDGRNSIKKENKESRKLQRFEQLDNTIIRFKAIFDEMEKDMKSSYGLFNLSKRLKDIADSTERFSKNEWKKVVNKTLGVNILDDYYQGEYYQKALGEWIETNAGLIKSIPKELLDEFKDTVYQEYISGSSITDLSKQIRERYGVSKSKSRMLARDQVGKLNAQITQHQQQNVGSNKYKWKTAGDGRVRSRHKELNNKICSWNDPPVVDKRTGRKAHPGEDYQCRCIAIPVFDLGQINIGAVAAD
jgi:SPP1 gp7 family putative phage head morphogenesis protein